MFEVDAEKINHSKLVSCYLNKKGIHFDNREKFDYMTNKQLEDLITNDYDIKGDINWKSLQSAKKITDCPLDQNKVWIKYDWNNRRIDPNFGGQLVIRDINEIVCNPGEAEIGSTLAYYGYPIALESGATYRLTVNFEGQANVRARYNVDGEWLREADTDYNLIIAQQNFTTITRDFTIPQGNVVWTVLLFSCGSSMEAEYYSVFIEKL